MRKAALIAVLTGVCLFLVEAGVGWWSAPSHAEEGDPPSQLCVVWSSGDGNETAFIGIVKVTDEDTLTWQGLGRVGGGATGDSPVYTFKRVEKEEGYKRAK